ncbi:MAG: hypothetical protein HY906_15950 [Deltaproteobacteria bacterium]|nr:hypothetical protein [Deltaproteobacteria bacterium]
MSELLSLHGQDAASKPAWAIAAGVREIGAAEAAGDLRPVDGGWSATLANGEPVVFRRLYAGAELCRHLIPSGEQWAAVVALAEERHVPVTLRTPPAADADLPSLEVLLRALAGSEQAELVANDWGTLRLARRAAPKVRPILGRCLRRHRRDPRTSDPPRSGAMSPEVLDLLARWGVDLVEADWLPDDVSPIALAMHLPYALVASGSLCLLSGLSRPLAEKFRPDQPCDAPCRGLTARLHHEGCSAPLLLRENTLFAANGVAGPAMARPDIARCVYDVETDPERTFLRSASGGEP